MNSVSKNITFREIVNDVFNAMLQGKKFTKSELNRLIPEGMNKSAHDIIRQLQKPDVDIKISHQREKNGQPAHWYVAEHGCKEFKYFPSRNCTTEVRKDTDSVKDDARNIINVCQRQGEEFIKEVIAGQYS